MERLYCRTCGIESGEMDDASLVIRWACQCDGYDVYGLDRMTAREFLWDGIRTFFTCVSWATEDRDSAVAHRDEMRERERLALLPLVEKEAEIAERDLATLQQKEATRQVMP